jgi:hypothetical protein
MRHRHAPAMFTIMVALTGALAAQTVPEVKLPPSPMGQAAAQLGGRWEKTENGERYRDGKWLVIAYGRPLLRGRTGIFGSGADYGKRVSPDATIWRMGANDTTTLTTQAPLQIGSGTLQPGVYNLFADLKATGWTLVVNTQPRQPKYDPNDKVLLYGSYNYDPKFDVLRMPMRMMPMDLAIEQLTIGFSDVRADGGTMFIAWGKTMGAVDFTAAAGS